MQNKKRAAVVGAATITLLAGGVAGAAWLSTGEGSGSVSSIDAADLVVEADGVEGLFPTGRQTISVTVSNVNPYKVALDSITVDDIAASDPGCNVTSVSAPSNDAPATTLDAEGSAGASRTFPFVVSMSNEANDDCQGNTFTVSFTATGHSSN